MGTHTMETRSKNWRKPLAQFFVPFLVIIVLWAFSITGVKLINNEFLSARALWSSDVYSQTRDRAFLKNLYSIDKEFLGRIDRNKSIDVIPWDIALLYGYNLAWKPRPVLQSYVSYTSALDDLDAAFFQAPGSPDQLIYSSASIDNRYFVFDTPHTFRVLLGKYRFITNTEDDRYALLKKRSRSLPLDMVFISQNEYLLNETIQIPNVRDGHVFAFLEIEPTILGKLLGFLYKSKPLYVEMALADGPAKTHRFIRDTGKNGLFVSVYVQDLDDLSSVFNATYEPNIKTIRFIGSDWLYTNRFRVSFYKIPFDG
jgi:hypothetical protein